MGNFKDLRVWSESLILCKNIYSITKIEPFSKDFGLKDQIQRSSTSILSNIAEGSERSSDRQSIYFYNVASASAAEVISQLNIAKEINYLDHSLFEQLENQAEKIRASLKNLIRSLNN